MFDVTYPLCRHLVAPAWAAWEHSAYLRHQRDLRRTQYDTPGAIRTRQWNAVSKLLRHAYHTTDYWRERLDTQSLVPDAIRSFEDFRRVPLLSKHDLRTRAEELVSREYSRATLHYHTTSGSTGHSVGVYVDDPAQQFRRACTLRSDEWTGWRLGQRTAMVWGNPEFLQHGWRGRLRNALLDRASYLDTLNMDRQALTSFVQTQRRRRPSLLMGHAHSLYLLAKFCQSLGGPGFQPTGILSTAMVLHDWERTVIEQVFGARVTNRYGCEEVALIACECAQHDGLHVNSDGVYLELLRADGTPAAPGEPGSVVVTDLSNRAMPLLRYQVGDVATWAQGGCACGRTLPRLARLEGREADYVITPAGNLVSGISLTENFATQIPGLAQMQIIQEQLDFFRLRVVRGPDFGPASEERICHLVAERFGSDVRYQCEYVDRIAPEPSGKYRFCISKVANPFTSRPQEVAT